MKILKIGYCTQLEKMAVKNGRLKTMEFPATVVLIKHEKIGYILFDTGYGEAFFEATQKFPYNLYKKVTPVYLKGEETVIEQLKKMNISAKDIKYIILSHFHADHIAGCRDFPNAKFLCSKVEYETIKTKKGLSALKEGFIPALLPQDFSDRTIFFEDQKIKKFPIVNTAFKKGIDLFGDETLYAIKLVGHTKGHYGLFLQDKQRKNYFFVGDACWSKKAFEEGILPHSFAGFIMKDQRSYKENIKKLYTLYRENKHIKIIPSHCKKTIESLMEEKNE
jgi:glyoxylase-like metal-dependent hydrolase (beta-lactamase superfamily II)